MTGKRRDAAAQLRGGVQPDCPHGGCCRESLAGRQHRAARRVRWRGTQSRAERRTTRRWSRRPSRYRTGQVGCAPAARGGTSGRAGRSRTAAHDTALGAPPVAPLHWQAGRAPAGHGGTCGRAGRSRTAAHDTALDTPPISPLHWQAGRARAATGGTCVRAGRSRTAARDTAPDTLPISPAHWQAGRAPAAHTAGHAVWQAGRAAMPGHAARMACSWCRCSQQGARQVARQVARVAGALGVPQEERAAADLAPTPARRTAAPL